MKPTTLKAGLKHSFSYRVPVGKTGWDRFNKSLAAKAAKVNAKVDA